MNQHPPLSCMGVAKVVTTGKINLLNFDDLFFLKVVLHQAQEYFPYKAAASIMFGWKQAEAEENLSPFIDWWHTFLLMGRDEASVRRWNAWTKQATEAPTLLNNALFNWTSWTVVKFQSFGHFFACRPMSHICLVLRTLLPIKMLSCISSNDTWWKKTCSLFSYEKRS